MIEILEGTVFSILKNNSLTLKDINGKKTYIKNIANFTLLKKFIYKYEKIIILKKSFKQGIKYLIININLPDLTNFKKLLSQILGIYKYEGLKYSDQIYTIAKDFIREQGAYTFPSSRSCWSVEIMENMSKEALMKIEEYMVFINRNSSSSNYNSLISFNLKFYCSIYQINNFKYIPEDIVNILINYISLVSRGKISVNNRDNQVGLINNNNLEDTELLEDEISDIKFLRPCNCVCGYLDEIFINLDIKKINYLWKFCTKNSRPEIIDFISSYLKFRIGERSIVYIRIFKFLFTIILELKKDMRKTYITFKELIDSLSSDIVIYWIEILKLLDEKQIIKIYDVNNERYITLYSRYEKELYITGFIKDRNNIDTNNTILVSNYEKLTLNKQQLDVVRNFNSYNITVLVGKPGTGKSYVTSTIINNINTSKIVCLGPTAISMKNIEKNIDKEILYLGTIHKFIHSGWGIKNFKGELDIINILDFDVIIVDEIGMVSTELLYMLFELISFKSLDIKLIFIGDPDQLGPIGYGNPLREIINSKYVNINILTKIVRQDDKTIPRLCDKINKGNFIETMAQFKSNGIPFIDTLVHIDKLDINVLKMYNETKFIAISNTNKGCYEINKLFQDKVLKKGYDDELATKFFVNDSVIILKNDYLQKIFNGDFGIISSISYDEDDKELLVTITKRDIENIQDLDISISYKIKVFKRVFGKSVYLNKECNVFIDNNFKYYVSNNRSNCPFGLGYCTTIHKYQGSEADYGLIYFEKSGSYHQTRDIPYTGTSRIKKKQVWVGNKKTIRAMVNKKNKYNFSAISDLLNK